MADKGLLDTLSGFLSEVAASRQAALGNAAPLQALQEQQKQQNLLDQLQAVSQNDLQGPFGQTLQRQLQFGDLEGAKKTLINLPKLKQFETSISDPSLGLSENQKQVARLLGAMSPETGQEYLKATFRESNVKTRQSDISKQNYEQRVALEEKKLKRVEAKIPGNILANAIKNKEVDPTDMQAVVGLLQGAGVSLPKTENEARIFVSRILNSPKIKTLLPPVEQKSFSQSIKDFFTRKKPAEQQPVQAPAPQPQQGFTIKRIK